MDQSENCTEIHNNTHVCVSVCVCVRVCVCLCGLPNYQQLEAAHWLSLASSVLRIRNVARFKDPFSLSFFAQQLPEIICCCPAALGFVFIISWMLNALAIIRLRLPRTPYSLGNTARGNLQLVCKNLQQYLIQFIIQLSRVSVCVCVGAMRCMRVSGSQ